MQSMWLKVSLAVFGLAFIFNFSNAQELRSEKIETFKAEIVSIMDGAESVGVKDFLVKVLNGEYTGKNITVYSNGLPYEVGDVIFVDHIFDTDGSEYWRAAEYDRLSGLGILGFVFVVFVLSLFGLKGLKSLMSLVVSMLIIFFVLIPLTLQGYNPLLVATLVSLALLFVVMFFTHGYNRNTLSAMLGCFISIVVTIFIAYFSIVKNRITGISSEESAALFYNAGGAINFELLVIASIIIGVIGIVDDSAITQAGVVSELKKANPNLSLREYYTRAMRVGRDHAGAMINTLVLAYTGSSLSLLLLFQTSTAPVLQIINKEIIATEIIRSLVGSIGLLLAIPLTTLFAVYLTRGESSHHGHNH